MECDRDMSFHNTQDALDLLPPRVASKARLRARSTVAGTAFDALTEELVVQTVVSTSLAGLGGLVVTPNVDILRVVERDAEARKLVRGADIVVADGMPIVWASRIAGDDLPARVTGSDLLRSVSLAAAEHDLSVFLLGGEEGVAERAREELHRLHPAMRIAGTHCPPHGFENDPLQLLLIERILRATQPAIVFVGLGFPKQERLAARLRKQFPNTWFLGVGGSFAMLAGDVHRAPQAVQALGLEWVYRLAQEPGRLFKRYIVQDLPFAAQLMVHAVQKRVRRPEPALNLGSEGLRSTSPRPAADRATSAECK